MSLVTTGIVKAPELEGTVDEFVDHLPSGKVWESKAIADSNMRALIGGAAKPFNLAEIQIETLAREFDVRQTVALIEEWETSVGLPDNCLGQLTDLELRRTAVINRLRRLPHVTLADLQELVDSLFPGAGITLIPGTEYFTFEYDFEIEFLGDVNERFIIVARVPSQYPTFEYDWEVEFTSGIDFGKLRCYLEDVLPVNVYLIIDEVGA